jgi:dTDP-4-amino-4,6-dideoxygalactose transaminase
VPLVDLRAEYAEIGQAIAAAVAQVISSGVFVQGPPVTAFEQAFAAYLGVAHVVGVGTGTDALMLALKAVGIGPGDEVILPAFTFVATAEAIVHTGATPVLVDVSPSTYTIDSEQIERGLTARTRAIVPVHLYGLPVDLGLIEGLAAARGIAVVEDAAQAHGAAYGTRRVGSGGRAAAFSFYPSKNLGAYGDAGAVATDDDGVAAQVRLLRDHGGVQKYQHEIVGYASRLDSLQAAVLHAKLPHLDAWNAKRRACAAAYDGLLAPLDGVTVPSRPVGATHVYHLYAISVDPDLRDPLRAYLQTRSIETGVHYPQPLHLTPAFAFLHTPSGSFPVAERLARSVLSLPMHPWLRPDQVEYVAREIAAFLGHRRQQTAVPQVG